MNEDIKKLEEAIRDSKKIVFFGGAGVSTESGIPDFRSSNGLYSKKYKKNISPEEIVSRTFFFSHTEEFYNFYKDKLLYLDAKPNIAHIRLAEYEKAGKDITIITQNIDGLHQEAGSTNVIELHGTIHKNHCRQCHKIYDVNTIVNSNTVPRCECGGLIKPNIVLYEEGLNQRDLYKARDAISECDLLIVAGTSLVVYPAAGLINFFKGKTMAIINLSTTNNDKDADIVIHDKIGFVLKQITPENIKE